MDKITIYTPRIKAKRIKLHIPYSMTDERTLLKSIESRFYHKEQKLWSILNTEENVKLLKTIFKDKYTIEEEPKNESFPRFTLAEKSLMILANVEQKLILKAYSPNTAKSYIAELSKFLKYFETYDLNTVTKEQIESYIYYLITKYKIGESMQNSSINAIKFYYEHVLGKPREYYEIQRPKRAKSLPNVLSPEEVFRLINSPENIKHKAMLYTLYSCGLRISELLNLRISDIRSDDSYIFIKGAKGKKDRRTLLSENLLKLLRTYYREFKPAYWLFEGQDGGKYSSTSVQKIYRDAQKKTGANPWSTPHTLRHSFATHMLESGENLRNIQVLLGHESTKTTEIYTHVINATNKKIKNPLDIILENHIFNKNSPTGI
jgi:integrase/recombinase XerD